MSDAKLTNERSILTQVRAEIVAQSALRNEYQDWTHALELIDSVLQSAAEPEDDRDRILRSSVPDRWKDCSSAVGAVQSYIAELEMELEARRQTEPRAKSSVAQTFRELADANEAIREREDDVIGFTATALRSFADQIDAENRAGES